MLIQGLIMLGVAMLVRGLFFTDDYCFSTSDRHPEQSKYSTVTLSLLKILEFPLRALGTLFVLSTWFRLDGGWPGLVLGGALFFLLAFLIIPELASHLGQWARRSPVEAEQLPLDTL